MSETIELVTIATEPGCYCKLFTSKLEEYERVILENAGVTTDMSKADNLANFLFYVKSKANHTLLAEIDLYSSRQHDDGSIIGELLTDDKDGSHIAKVIKAPSEQGMIFKDPIAFKRRVGICYIPENDFLRSGYTYYDFLSLAGGSKEVAEYLFETVDWQHPETVLDEDFSIGEIDHCPQCGRLYLSYDKPMCNICLQRGSTHEKSTDY